MKELLDITTRHAYGEEVARAIFIQSRGKDALGGGRREPTKSADKGAKKGTGSNKRGAKVAAPVSHSCHQL
jgi:hypothetical protein